MLFNSLRFAVFFLIVYALYLCLKRRWQNVLLLAASYIFYSFWDWRFLPILIAAGLLNYYFALKIDATEEEPRRKLLLAAIVIVDLAILGVFKYFNFFSDSLQIFLWALGFKAHRLVLDVILPLGISFFTFKAISYPVDVYRRVIKPTRSVVDFSLFIAFFPQLIAGPIARAKELLVQIGEERHVTRENFYQGSWLFFWGLFKKIVVADNIARVTAMTFNPTLNFSAGIDSLVGIYALALQIYADFSGYSDMANGLAVVMGFPRVSNFKTPFFSSNLYDFWLRWHISLTSWIKEYVYYPLALARPFGRQLIAPAVIIITWTLMGLWHGGTWPFIWWGVYHGLLLVLYSKLRPYINMIKPRNPMVSRLWYAAQVAVVFNLFCIGIIFFGVDTIVQFFVMLANIASIAFFRQNPNAMACVTLFLCALPMLAMEYFQYKKADEMVIFRWPTLVRAAIYFVLLYLIVLYGDFSAQTYYYFQF